MRIALTGGRLVDPEGEGLVEATLLVENGRILGRLSPGDAIGEDFREVAHFGRLIAPGFLDVHFHGELFCAETDEFAGALARAADEMLAFGTTGFLATTLCWADDVLQERVSELARLCSEGGDPGTATCLGIHLEGPWVSDAVPGALAADCMRPFEPARDRAVLDRAEDQLRMVTLAPEVPGSDALLDDLGKRGVVASLGHSLAQPTEIDRGVASGLCHVTHLFNAMGSFHHREPGVAGSVLADDRLTCDLICDGHHVHADVVRIAARTLGERLVLITDRVDLERGSPTEGESDAPSRLADGTIAGSRLGLARAVGNVMEFAGIALVEAVAAATLRPARLLGIEAERGTLRPGARADLAILDEAGNVVETWTLGRPVYQRGAAA